MLSLLYLFVVTKTAWHHFKSFSFFLNTGDHTSLQWQRQHDIVHLSRFLGDIQVYIYLNNAIKLSASLHYGKTESQPAGPRPQDLTVLDRQRE